MKPKFYRKVLGNGMTVILEKRNVPVVAVSIAIKAGGINEDFYEKGISHFIEHMLYKGTTSRNAKQISESIEKNGGVLNGFTEENITAFWCKMPSNKLSIALDVLSDMVKNPLFDEKELEKERKVIFEEMKMRRDDPRGYISDKIQGCLYGPPLGLDLIGSVRTMSSIDRNKLVKRFKETYTPDNMILCVVGDADFSELIKFAERNFGNDKGKVKQFKIVEKNKSVIEKRPGLDQANLMLAFHTPLAYDKKSYAAQLLVALMSHGLSSRLFQEIREKRNLAYSIAGHAAINRYYSYALIYAGTSKENVKKVRKLILEEFNKVSKELDEKELREVKEQIIGNYKISMEDSAMHMAHLLLEEVNGTIKDVYNFEKKIREVKLRNVKELAKIKKHSFFALLPG